MDNSVDYYDVERMVRDLESSLRSEMDNRIRELGREVFASLNEVGMRLNELIQQVEELDQKSHE